MTRYALPLILALTAAGCAAHNPGTPASGTSAPPASPQTEGALEATGAKAVSPVRVPTGDTSQAAFAGWLEAHVARIRPLEKEVALSYWKASGSGSPEDYQANADAELALQKIYADRETFTWLKAVSEAGQVKDPLLARQLELLYLGYLGNQFDPALMEKIVALGTSIEEKFNTYRAAVGDRRLSDNEVEEVLRKSRDSAERKRVWEGSKGIGEAVAKDLVQLVKMRNEAARQLGYDNYYVLSIARGEQDEKALFKLLDDMASQTDQPFREVKAELDAALAARYGLKPAELRPWHYEDRFFQEPPSVGSVDLDPYYKGKDVVELALKFYDSIGLPAREVIARSDVEGREGKYQHAYCTDMDREGDVRVMMSVKDDAYWMNTTLHELGHAVYSVGHDANLELPYTLRDAAHTLTTEGFAELTGRLAGNPYWMKRFLGLTDAQVRELEPRLRKKERMGALVFARWCMVMANFERELYRNPDQDLNGLWWKLVQRYQGVTPPEGRNAADWASKIHLVSNPVYYHNYLLGELYAAQLHAAVASRFFPGQDPWTVTYADSREAGRYFAEKVFRPGSMWRWDRFTIESTGAPLSADAFAKAYVSGGK